MFFRIIFVLFIIAISFGGNYHIGPTTPRQIMSVVMLIPCLLNFGMIKEYFNKYIVLYVLYIVITFFSAGLDGNLNSFFRVLISQHVVALVCYSAVLLLYKKTNSVSLLVYTLFFCGIANMAVCLMQRFGISLGYEIGYLFIDASEETANRHMEQLIEGSGNYLLGMRGDAVHNGYFQMIMPFLTLYVYYKAQHRSNLIWKLIVFSLFCSFFMVVFWIQERSCLIMSFLALVIFLLSRFMKNSPTKKVFTIVWVVLGIVIVSVFLEPYLIELFASSRFNTSERNVRFELFSNALSFAREHFFFGGEKTFLSRYEYLPHNVFLNALVEGGIFGLIIGGLLYIKQISRAITQIFKNDVLISILSVPFLAYTLNSLLHNDSVLSGDAIVWLLWAIVMIYLESVRKEVHYGTKGVNNNTSL